MEKDFGSWSQNQRCDWQSPHLDTSNFPFNLGQQNTLSAFTSPSTNMVPYNVPRGFSFSEVLHSNVSQLNEPHASFYCLPHFRQTFSPAPNSMFEEEASAIPCKDHEVVTPKLASGCFQKRFLVFDQSGDKTTLIFSSWGPKLDNVQDENKAELGTERDIMQRQGLILTDDYDDTHKDDVESEMHDDTEDINALLDSDDDDYCSEDDETASTGHSPSTMTGFDGREWLECAEEVASSAGPTKRMKWLDGTYCVPALVDTANSVKPRKCFDYEDDDAESSSARGQNQDLGELGPLSGNKRSRKEKIQETLSVLQKIIPGGSATDAIGIFDEAIDYLSTLKHTVEDIL